MTNFQAIKISRKQQMIYLSRSFGLFWIPKKSLLKSSFPNWKIPGKIFLPKKIPKSKISYPKKSFDHPRHSKSCGVPNPWALKATHVFQQTHSSWSVSFGYWSAVRSRRAGKKIGKMRGLSPPTTTPRCFFFFFLSAHISFPTKKKYTCFTACQ